MNHRLTLTDENTSLFAGDEYGLDRELEVRRLKHYEQAGDAAELSPSAAVIAKWAAAAKAASAADEAVSGSSAEQKVSPRKLATSGRRKRRGKKAEQTVATKQ